MDMNPREDFLSLHFRSLPATIRQAEVARLFVQEAEQIRPKRDPLREARGIARACRYGLTFFGALFVWWLLK